MAVSHAAARDDNSPGVRQDEIASSNRICSFDSFVAPRPYRSNGKPRYPFKPDVRHSVRNVWASSSSIFAGLSL